MFVAIIVKNLFFPKGIISGVLTIIIAIILGWYFGNRYKSSLK
ncbi:hypothetical protein [Methanobrevibacter arboriphilus]|nr:hypothetical protein [Methanobrevibacter arboriphilus]